MNETHASSPAVEAISARDAVAASIDFAELQAGQEGLFWNEYRPQDGACRLWRWQQGQPVCLTPSGFSVRSRVYEYGGGSFCLAPQCVVFVNDSDQQLYRQALDGSAPQPLTHGQKRYGGLAYAAGLVLAVEEEAASPMDIHRVVAIELAGGGRTVLAEGADFYASPILCDDGTRLAWVEWSRPHQPWGETRLMCAERRADGGWFKPVCLAGDGPEPESLQQPRFDALSRLKCLTDRNGFWQPWGESGEGWLPLPSLPADHAGAPWQLNASSWLPLPGDEFLATWYDDGFARLGICHADGRIEDYTGAFSHFRSLAADTDHLYTIAQSPQQPAAVVAIDRHSHACQVLAGGASPLPAEAVSLPVALSFPSGNDYAYAFFYPAQGRQGPAPLVVFIHGGPTSAFYPVLDLRLQFWTQRGFSVAQLNYRGSTCYGRAYRQALHLHWGETDVEDACALVAWLGEKGLADPASAFIRGSSAGGYTTLCALAFTDVFRGGASLYGVSDPAALARDTHKFETDYLHWLIGDPDIDQPVYAARTPLLHADRINVPVVFFQGELDKVVVPEQTRAMVAALAQRGVPVEAHYYPEERHGFHQAANMAGALEAEWRFYEAVLNAPNP
ncbi:S9 family peptidase [Pseudomonas typographi]|uniref:S9 family peptidase n=1 Tax=Pseudomonas typographi TaxID=2715964 RepID=UPI001689C278|nr:prolyl oligopeptidase family serine peptidase [Pseudomonas typographi]MBD1552170.1 S9 family peptidase [Pseudomonas typographi]